jgi:hypothetical protein
MEVTYLWPPRAWLSGSYHLRWGSSPDGPYDDETARYAVQHPVVITNGNYMCHAAGGAEERGGEEERLVVAARQLLALIALDVKVIQTPVSVSN